MSSADGTAGMKGSPAKRSLTSTGLDFPGWGVLQTFMFGSNFDLWLAVDL